MAYSINPNIEKSRGKAIYDLLVNKAIAEETKRIEDSLSDTEHDSIVL